MANQAIVPKNQYRGINLPVYTDEALLKASKKEGRKFSEIMLDALEIYLFGKAISSRAHEILEDEIKSK